MKKAMLCVLMAGAMMFASVYAYHTLESWKAAGIVCAGIIQMAIFLCLAAVWVLVAIADRKVVPSASPDGPAVLCCDPDRGPHWVEVKEQGHSVFRQADGTLKGDCARYTA